MKTILFEKLRHYHQQHAIRKTRQVLMSMSQRQLVDMGISRALLNEGTHRWPWREMEDQPMAGTATNQQQGKVSTFDVSRTAQELKKISDHELHGIAINQRSVKNAVFNGANDKTAA